jgi:hypothetical protein
MNFTSDLGDVTYNKIAPRVVDNITYSTTLVKYLSTKSQRWGGGPIQIDPVMTSTSPTGGFINSMDTLAFAVTNTMQTLSFGPSLVMQTIAISDAERSINENNMRAAVRLVEQKMDAAQESLRLRFSAGVYSAGGGNNIYGLENIVDAGTNTSSYGGVSRASNAWVNAQVFPAAGGTIALETISQAIDAASAGGIASETTDFAIMTSPIWTLLESLFQPTNQGRYVTTSGDLAQDATRGDAPSDIRLSSGMSAVGGFTGMAYRSASFFKDDSATIGDLYLLNSNYLNLYKVPMHNQRFIPSQMKVTRGVGGGAPDANINSSGSRQAPKALESIWQMRDFMRVPNQLSETAVITFFGQLTSNQPRRQAKVSGITNAS